MSLRFLLPSCLLVSSLAPAQDYFPLQVGNQWVYRTTGTAPERKLALEINAVREIDGNTYYRLAGLPSGAYWLRMSPDGALLAYDETAKADRTWYLFQAAENETWETSIPSCCGKASIVSKTAAFNGPLGQLNNALEITYPGVFQVGIVREQFLPSIGLAFREENIGGPGVLRHELVYARIAGNNVYSAAEVSFRLALDNNTYSPAARLNARLTLANRQNELIRLTFPSAQRYDLAIRDAAGKEVYRWSEGKAFAQIFGSIAVGGEMHYLVSVPLGGLAPGDYSVEAWLATAGEPQWKATSRFALAANP